mmetsp:Transcript_26143/g.73211  ORF Transcript_26143/g.73211 Transcript_26143/m.73211 type:complete len:426 (-) Transcript_26143:476-1753(-)
MGQAYSLHKILSIAVERTAAQLVGISTAVAVACLLAPDSGYARARKLVGLAIQGMGKVLPRLGDIFYGGTAGSGKLEVPGGAAEEAMSSPQQGAPGVEDGNPPQPSLDLGLRSVVVQLDLFQDGNRISSGMFEDALSSPGTETLGATADLYSVPGVIGPGDGPQDATQACTQALLLEMERCRELVDAARRASGLANRYGRTWSRWIPRLGHDPKGAKAILTAEEMVSLVRQLAEIVHGTSSVVFGNYSLPHSAAISPNGLPCFLETEEGRRLAGQYSEASNSVMHGLGQAVEYIGCQVYVENPFGCVKGGGLLLAESSPRLPPLQEIKGSVSSHAHTEAYVASWFAMAEQRLAGRGSNILPSTDGDGIQRDSQQQQPSCLKPPGYSPADIYRLHFVLFILSDIVRLVLGSVDDSRDSTGSSMRSQ